MRRLTTLLIPLTLLAFTTIDNLHSENRIRIASLEQGMSKAKVLEHMGTRTITHFDEIGPFSITNPYRSEVLIGEENTVEIVYYFTDQLNESRPLESAELTPLVFEHSELIGWGWSFLKGIVATYELTFEMDEDQ